MLQDLNFETGAKLTGEISTWEKIVNLPVLQSSKTAAENWFNRDMGARITDISKHNGVVNWSVMWPQVDGVIARLGYGSVIDPKFDISTVPGFKSSMADGKYRGLYHYMNTGVSVSNQIHMVLACIGKLASYIDAFWVDVEGSYNETSSSAFFSNPLQIMRAVRQEYPHIAVGFYTNGRYYRALDALGDVDSWLGEFLFWYAWYPWQMTKYPSPPPGVALEDVYLWQYSADGNGMGENYGVQSADIDLNVSRDSAEELLSEYYGDGSEEDKTVSEELKTQLINESKMYETAIDEAHEAIEKTMNTLRVKAGQHSQNIAEIVEKMDAENGESDFLYEASVSVASLNVRSGPSIHFSVVDSLGSGEVVQVWEEVEADGYIWGRISESKDLWCAVDFTEKI